MYLFVCGYSILRCNVIHCSCVKVRRRRRGGFRKGFLSRKKGERSRSRSSDSVESGNKTDVSTFTRL